MGVTLENAAEAAGALVTSVTDYTLASRPPT